MLSNLLSKIFRHTWYFKERLLITYAPKRYIFYFLYRFFRSKKKEDAIYPFF